MGSYSVNPLLFLKGFVGILVHECEPLSYVGFGGIAVLLLIDQARHIVS